MNGTELLGAYRTMRIIRGFEEGVVRLVQANEIAGVTHEYIGQEAVATGMCAELGPDDVITSTHRGHGHLLARGAEPVALFAELMGRLDGVNHGRGGSMHAADVSLGIFGANGMVGAGAPWAAGAAGTPLPDGGRRVAVAFFGDGALNQGVLLETMNLAAVWGLPLVFCCENNGYAVSTPSSATTSTRPADRARAFGIEAREVDGMDVVAVREAAAWAVGLAREGRPAFLDCVCYRFVGHHTAEASMNLGYRTDEEIEHWRRRDPLRVARERIEQLLPHGAAAVDGVDDEVAGLLESAIASAATSPRPDPSDALAFAYASPLPGLSRGVVA